MEIDSPSRQPLVSSRFPDLSRLWKADSANLGHLEDHLHRPLCLLAERMPSQDALPACLNSVGRALGALHCYRESGD